MTIKKRRFLLILMILIFIPLGGIAIFYSLGYKPILSDNCPKNILSCFNISFQKSGGIAIETNPREVSIKIDGKEYKNKSNLIQPITLIKGLTSKYHKVEITKSGYFKWDKTLRVLPEQVAEALNIILVPQSPEIKNSEFLSVRSGNIVSFENGKFLIKTNPSGNYYLYNEKSPKSAINISSSYTSIKAQTIKKAFLYAYDSAKIILESGTEIVAFDTQKSKAETLLKISGSPWTMIDSSLFYASYSDKKVAGIYALSLRNKKRNLVFELPAKTNIVGGQIIISNQQDKIAFISASNGLYLWDSAKNSVVKIADNVKGAEFSPDSGKIAFWDNENNPDIKIYFIKDWKEGVRKKAGEIIVLGLSGFGHRESPEAVYWHKDSFHIFAKFNSTESSGHDLIFAEVDDRSPLNYYRVFSSKTDFLYLFGQEKLYFLDGEKMFSWSF